MRKEDSGRRFRGALHYVSGTFRHLSLASLSLLLNLCDAVIDHFELAFEILPPDQAMNPISGSESAMDSRNGQENGILRDLLCVSAHIFIHHLPAALSCDAISSSQHSGVLVVGSDALPRRDVIAGEIDCRCRFDRDPFSAAATRRSSDRPPSSMHRARGSRASTAAFSLARSLSALTVASSTA